MLQYICYHFLSSQNFNTKWQKLFQGKKRNVWSPVGVMWYKQNLPNLVLSPLVVQAVLNNYLCKWLKWCGLYHSSWVLFHFFCCVTSMVFFPFVFSNGNIWARHWKIKGVWLCHIFWPQTCGPCHWKAHRFGKLYELVLVYFGITKQ